MSLYIRDSITPCGTLYFRPMECLISEGGRRCSAPWILMGRVCSYPHCGCFGNSQHCTRSLLLGTAAGRSKPICTFHSLYLALCYFLALDVVGDTLRCFESVHAAPATQRTQCHSIHSILLHSILECSIQLHNFRNDPLHLAGICSAPLCSIARHAIPHHLVPPHANPDRSTSLRVLHETLRRFA